MLKVKFQELARLSPSLEEKDESKKEKPPKSGRLVDRNFLT
jgi:hypothetical protein